MSTDSYIFRERRVGDGAPLFLALHGTGGDENQFFTLASELMPGANIIAPRGDVLEYGAARFFRRTGEGVYDMADLARRTEALADFVEAHKVRLAASRVIGLGYSNGANILAAMTFARPGLFDDVMLMHPLIPWQPEPVAGLADLRVLITAGRNDPICPPRLTSALEAYYAGQGSDVELSWHAGGHEVRNNEVEAITRFVAA